MAIVVSESTMEYDFASAFGHLKNLVARIDNVDSQHIGRLTA